jgi:hypothetical protein
MVPFKVSSTEEFKAGVVIPSARLQYISLFRGLPVERSLSGTIQGTLRDQINCSTSVVILRDGLQSKVRAKCAVES